MRDEMPLESDSESVMDWKSPVVEEKKKAPASGRKCLSAIFSEVTLGRAEELVCVCV